MQDDFPAIPDFLVATKENTEQARKDYRQLPRTFVERKVAKSKYKAFQLPKTMEPQAWALLKQMEKDKAEKQAAHFAKLRAEKGK